MLSVCRLSSVVVYNIRVFWQKDWSYDHAVFIQKYLKDPIHLCLVNLTTRFEGDPIDRMAGSVDVAAL